MSAKQKIVNC